MSCTSLLHPGHFCIFGRLAAVAATCALWLFLPAAWSAADEPPRVQQQEAPKYESHIAPLLKTHCLRCHNAQSMKAELDLSTPLGIFAGGESGPILTPGSLDESLLYEMVHEGLMPPEEEEPLGQEQIATIARWIESGTPFVAHVDPQHLAAAGEVNNHIIEPLLLLRCAACHGLRKQEGGLDLRSKASILKGGKSGPAMVLGKPEESLLLKRIHAGEMPPRDQLIAAAVKPMPADEIAQLARWIELGAPEVQLQPDVATPEGDPLVTDEDRRFWAFQPPRPIHPPLVNATERVRNPIDAFILARLEESGLTLAGEIDKATWLRRVSFDLTGLPPSPAEVEAFLADDSSNAYEAVVDRLLASPRYGERWARIWLDAAGYADSEGKRSADPIRPYAYKYRDYVIRAFNADKPYDRFLMEQIAGDELADYEHAKTISQQLVDNLIATGFLRMAPDGTGSDIVNFVPERIEVIADEIDIFSSTVLGLTIKCARCHSHKYDPIPQRDYYRLLAVFKGAYDEHDWLKPSFVASQTKVKKPGRVLAYATPQERLELERRNQRIEGDIRAQQQNLAQLAESVRQQYREQQLASLPESLRGDVRTALATSPEERDEVQQYLAGKLASLLTLDDGALKRHPAYSRAATEIQRVIESLEGEKSDGIQIRALWDRGTPSPTYIYRRGDYRQPRRLVGPGVPSVLTDGKTPFVVRPPWPGATKTGRRLALARWLVQPDHPLTARVMVNRIWKHHFGEGIVRTLDNFGSLGTRPSHPQLLDWLACEFVRQGWSMKALHRLMVTSSTYRQVSLASDGALQLDPDNQLVSRMPMRRMEAEQLRDTLLMVAGKLDQRQFGRADTVTVRQDGLVTSTEGPRGWRRSIYVRQRRKEIPTMLETFDLPQMNPNCQLRTSSTVAQQALHLMNDTMVRRLSQYFAEQVLLRTADPRGQVRQVYLIALSRYPLDEEEQLGVEALLQLAQQWQAALTAENKPLEDVTSLALATYCHTIMNSAAFLYID